MERLSEEETDKFVNFHAFCFGIQHTQRYDPHIARGFIRNLAKRYQEMITHLPSEVESIIVETNGGEIEIVREDLDPTYEKPQKDNNSVSLRLEDTLNLLKESYLNPREV